VSDPANRAWDEGAFKRRGRSRPVCCPIAGIAGGKERRPFAAENGRAAAPNFLKA